MDKMKTWKHGFFFSPPLFESAGAKGERGKLGSSNQTEKIVLCFVTWATEAEWLICCRPIECLFLSPCWYHFSSYNYPLWQWFPTDSSAMWAAVVGTAHLFIELTLSTTGSQIALTLTVSSWRGRGQKSPQKAMDLLSLTVDSLCEELTAAIRNKLFFSKNGKKPCCSLESVH